jgi:hypothetical protein
MGAGCYYTLPDSRDVLAYWLAIEFDESLDEFENSDNFECELEYLKNILLDLPLCGQFNGKLYYGKNFKIDLDSTYHGDGILINLIIDLPEYNEKYNFVASNLERVYNRIIKHVNKSLPLKRAAGAWCSAQYAIGEIK